MRLGAGLWCATALALTLAACGSSEPEERASDSREAAPRRETVFDPLTSTIGRAQSAQQTVDQQAAEQRRRIEEAER
ncbi:MAG TPA: hypothetical protein VM692_14455 [Gammaproteobacteria bacterium]|nr:hypothetical protein [Gammaproteobacteria bacterium]